MTITTTATAPAAHTRTRVDVLGCAIDSLDMAETIARVDELIAARGFAQHMAINTAKLVKLQKDDELRAITNGCELVNADGQGVVWAARLLGSPLPSRVAGIDLMHELLALAERSGYRVYFLGATQEVLDRAVERLRERHPSLDVAGARHGYFSEGEIPSVCAAIRDARADILFVAMSTPQKEYFMGRYGPTLDVPFVMGVGGAIDVVAGVTKRAPGFMQRSGLEWLFRLLQEPRRMFRRYAASNGQFALLVGRALLARAAASSSGR